MVKGIKNKRNKYGQNDQHEPKLEKSKIQTPKEKGEHQGEPQLPQQKQEYDENEKLFWKVIKNKFLKTHIFSFINDKSKIQNKIYKYDEIYSVQFLIKNNLIELLKYKVKRGETLIDFLPFLKKRNFQNYKPPIEDPNDRKSIFKVIKNDTEFYQNLFKNYNQNFISNEKTFFASGFIPSILPLPTENNRFDLKIETKKQIIKDDNECAFKIFQNVNSVPITDEDFCEAISIGSIKTAKLIFNRIKKEPNFKKHELIGKVWKNYTFLNSNSPMFKDFTFKNSPSTFETYSTLSLSSQSLSPSSPSSSSQIPTKSKFKIINKSVKLLLIDLKFIPPKEMNNINQDIFKIDIKVLKVKHLLESCKTISMILQFTNLFDTYLKNLKKKEISDKFMGFEGELQTYLPNPLIDFLSFEKLIEIEQNLKPKSIESLVHSISTSDTDSDNIFKLFKMLLTFTDYSTVFRDNFIFFKCKYFNDYSLCMSAKDKQLPFQLGSFENISPNSSYLSNLFLLFSYCQNEKEIQTKFINQAIENIIQSLKDSKMPIIKPLNLIITLLHFDYIEFISIFYKNLKDIIKNDKDLLPIDLISHIKSTTTFDFFINSNLLIKDQINLKNCLISKNSGGGGGSEPLNLMYHIKSNYNNIYKELISSIDTTINDPIYYSIESLLFIYNNIKDFEYCYERINVWKRSNIALSLYQFIELVNCTPITKQYNYICGNGSFDNFNYDSCLLKYNWVIRYKKHDIQSNRCDSNYGLTDIGIDAKLVIPLYQYYNHNKLMLNDIFPKLNTLDPIIFNKPQNHLIHKIISAIGERGDIKSLETLLNLMDFSNFNRTSFFYFYSFFLFVILAGALKNGHLKLFQYLKSNYPHFFNEKLNFGDNINNLESYGVFQINTLFEILRDISIIYNLVDIFNEMKNHIFFDHFDYKNK
ncbi:hypothetical protein ACTFIW_002146 [Dictyostelium discoideum]